VREVHFHVALLGSRCFRFLSLKRALLERHGLASHWSSSHVGYWSAVRYGFMPTPRKPASEIDPEPLRWAAGGLHPPLFEASQEPVTARATKVAIWQVGAPSMKQASFLVEPCGLDASRCRGRGCSEGAIKRGLGL
jgi:hypothetical protein